MADSPPAAGAQPVAEGTDTEQTPEQETMFGCPVALVAGQPVVFVDRERYLETMRQVRHEGFELFIDLTVVDYLAHPGRPLPPAVTPERFELVVNLLDIVEKRRVRFRCQVRESDPQVPSLFDIWPGVDA